MKREKVSPIKSLEVRQVKKILEKVGEKKKQPRSYHYTFAELIDRLCLAQMKENYGGDYKAEIQHILHDIDVHLESGVKIDANGIRAIIAMTQSNVEIWVGEDKERNGVEDGRSWEEKYKSLLRTHRLNSSRSECKARLQILIGGATDKKLNYHQGEWNISW